MTGDLIAFLNARLDEDEAMVAEPHIWPTTFRPERALREVGAKRAIVRRYARFSEGRNGDGSLIDRLAARPAAVAMRPAILDLATVYSDHPDYRPEWKP